jgi:hypothetical protein
VPEVAFPPGGCPAPGLPPGRVVLVLTITAERPATTAADHLTRTQTEKPYVTSRRAHETVSGRLRRIL